MPALDLDGPRARIERANGQIIALQKSVQRFFRDNLYEIGVAEYNSRADNYSLRVKSGPQEFPVDWSLLIGEIAHNLRSGLDGLTWQLALLTTPKPYDFTAFPICRVGHGKRRRKGSHRFHRQFWAKDVAPRLLQSLDRPFWTRIEGFQPYKRGNGGRLSPLFLLEELNNTDKHRLLVVVASSPASLEFTGLSGGTHFKPRVTLHTNAKIGWVRDVPPNQPGHGRVYLLDPATGNLLEPKLQVNVTVAPGVVFGDGCDAVTGFPVIRTLQGMANEVSRIVESFADEFS